MSPLSGMVVQYNRRGNGHDNAVAESFFNLLKPEGIRCRTYKARDDARRDAFGYIKMFYNPKPNTLETGCYLPAEFEQQQKMNQEGI